MDEYKGWLLTDGPDQSTLRPAGAFRVARERGFTYLTRACPPGPAGSDARLFRAEDGRTWDVLWIDVRDERSRFFLPATFPAVVGSGAPSTSAEFDDGVRLTTPSVTG